MKKPTIFNSSEKELLIAATQMSLQSAVNFPDKYERIKSIATELLTMLKSDWDHYYPVECVNYIEKVIKDFLKPYAEKIKDLLDTPLSKILEQQNIGSLDLKLIDKCNSILGKLGRRKTKFNFVEIFERIHGSQEKVTTTQNATAFEWEPVAKSETLLFELIPGESGVGATPVDAISTISNNKETESSNSNLFIDLITEQHNYREVA